MKCIANTEDDKYTVNIKIFAMKSFQHMRHTEEYCTFT